MGTIFAVTLYQHLDVLLILMAFAILLTTHLERKNLELSITNEKIVKYHTEWGSNCIWSGALLRGFNFLEENIVCTVLISFFSIFSNFSTFQEQNKPWITIMKNLNSTKFNPFYTSQIVECCVGVQLAILKTH